MRLEYLPKKRKYIWKGRYDERHYPERMGFEWDGTLKKWATTNPAVAIRTGLPGQQVSLATGKLNMSTADMVVEDVLTRVPNVRARNAKDTLLPYQSVPYAYAGNDRFNLLADDTGLGKTVEALSFELFEGISSNYNHLIICPANKREDWAAELRKWNDRNSIILYEGKPIPILPVRPNIIVSWALLRNYQVLDLIKNYSFSHLIYDEVHAIKNYDSLRTHLALRLSARCDRVSALSATFPPNYPIEMYPLLNHFSPHTIDNLSYNKFLYKHCIVRDYQGALTPVGFRNTLELSERLRTTCMVRRRWHWVNKQLPPPILKIQTYTPDAEWRELIKEESQYEAEYVKDSSPTKLPIGQYAAFRRRMAIKKVDLVAQHISSLLHNEDKVIVFGWHIDMIKGLAEKLKKYNPLVITGAIPAKKKFELKEKFQTDPSHRLFIGNIQSAGTGIDLFAARRIVFAEASWVPGDNHQAIGRAQRHGQVRQVYVEFVVVDGTLDGRVLQTAMKKAEGVSEVLDRKEQDEWE